MSTSRASSTRGTMLRPRGRGGLAGRGSKGTAYGWAGEEYEDWPPENPPGAKLGAAEE
ncbi:hypothetical protein [Nocardia wallacei]|uniref:hypothetical protein n=1 Tax=Nocardia wallacei TaxID=480035 RepID=UPI0024553D3F|nr:hypothetical protein [Nocardia wallacei]